MPAPGDLLEGKYRLLRVLGVGGWGTVFEGQNSRTLKRVAIKVLHAEMGRRMEMVTRFEREAQAASHIGSEHIVEVYDLGELEDGTRYMVMEFLEGEPLSKRIQDAPGKRIDAESCALLAVQVLEGLAAAHDAGILHRDLKPDNLFIIPSATGEEFVKLLDFGISKFAQQASNMTVTGTVMGSPCYMSPEQARSGSKDMDLRSDLYSVGVVLYEALTGDLPYMADTFNELLFKIALEEPPEILTHCPDLDPGFAAIVRKAMAREAKNRYSSAREFQEAIWAWLISKGHARHAAQLVRKARGGADAGMMTTPANAISAADGFVAKPKSGAGALPRTPASDPHLPHIATVLLADELDKQVYSGAVSQGGATRIEGRGQSDKPNAPVVTSPPSLPNKTVGGLVVAPAGAPKRSIGVFVAAALVGVLAVGGFVAVRVMKKTPAAASTSAPQPDMPIVPSATAATVSPSATVVPTATASSTLELDAPPSSSSSAAPQVAGKNPKGPKGPVGQVSPTVPTVATAATPTAAPSAAPSTRTVDGRRISTEL